ncbi:MAG: hypothetical protein DRP64_04885 [Verrucomicrobia bacterium]|nr:MAG: hypothetical protein DRP64_04885 [Verrucomicrobiota bacterium]
MNIESWVHTNRIGLVGLAIVSCALLWGSGAVAGGDRYGTNSRIVFRDDNAPGLGAAERVVGLDHFSVGSNGNLLVVGTINSGSADARAVWYGSPDDITLLYRDDLPVPGFEYLADFGTLQMARMSGNGGRVAFLTDDADSARIWTHFNGETSLAKAGANRRYRQVSIANNGVLVVGVGMTYKIGDQGDSFTEYSVSRGYPDALMGIVSDQYPIPGFGMEFRYSLDATVNCEGPVSYQSIDTNGHYLALVGLVSMGYKATVPDSLSVLYFEGGNLRGPIVVLEGGEVEGTPPGYRFVDYGFDENARLSRASVSEDERVVFQWETELNGDIWAGLWSFHTGGTILAVGEGDPVANRPGQSVRPNTNRTRVPGGSGEIQLWNLPQSSRQGDIVFPGEILETGNPAIFRYTGGNVEVLAEAGHPFEDGSANSWGDALPLPSDDAPFMTPYLNAPGQVLLWANVDNGAGSMVGLSPWIIDRLGMSTPVVLPGDTFEFAAGDVRNVTPQSHHDAATAKWYGGTVISDAGHVLTKVQSSAGWGILYTDPATQISRAPDVVVADNELGIRLLPHPFQGQGVIKLWSRNMGPVRVSIFDTAGRLVRRLDTRFEAGGSAIVHWDGRGRSGSHVASGVYFLRVEQGRESATRKLVLVR